MAKRKKSREEKELFLMERLHGETKKKSSLNFFLIFFPLFRLHVTAKKPFSYSQNEMNRFKRRRHVFDEKDNGTTESIFVRFSLIMVIFLFSSSRFMQRREQ